MQTIAINLQAEKVRQSQFISISKLLENIVIVSEEKRFGVTAALILISVTVAGFNVVIPPMTGVSPYLMTPGIFMAFMSNSIALAQVKMKWVLLFFTLSMFINAVISIYCVTLL